MDWALVGIGVLLAVAVAVPVVTRWRSIAALLPTIKRKPEPAEADPVDALRVLWRHVEQTEPDQLDALEPFFRIAMKRGNE